MRKFFVNMEVLKIFEMSTNCRRKKRKGDKVWNHKVWQSTKWQLEIIFELFKNEKVQNHYKNFCLPWTFIKIYNKSGNFTSSLVSKLILDACSVKVSSINDVMQLWTFFDPLFWPAFITKAFVLLSQNHLPPSLYYERDVIYGRPQKAFSGLHT